MDPQRLRAIWENEVDRLELDVIRAERLLRGLAAAPFEHWAPPLLPGQMPADLADRVAALLDRQEEARRLLKVALAEAQKQLEYADRVSAATSHGPGSPIYLDLQA